MRRKIRIKDTSRWHDWGLRYLFHLVYSLWNLVNISPLNSTTITWLTTPVSRSPLRSLVTNRWWYLWLQMVQSICTSQRNFVENSDRLTLTQTKAMARVQRTGLRILCCCAMLWYRYQTVNKDITTTTALEYCPYQSWSRKKMMKIDDSTHCLYSVGLLCDDSDYAKESQYSIKYSSFANTQFIWPI